ncbi:MAG: APC family permease [Gemmatimonadaceae bacterium]|nr:APC family permease [Gemmatimonadaceae bacterium]
MLAWNLWLYVIALTSEVGLAATTYLSYAIGPSAAWMTSSAWVAALASAVIVSLMVVASTIGLSVGKWVHNFGGMLMLIVFGVVILLPILRVAHWHTDRVQPVSHQHARAVVAQPEHLGQDGLWSTRWIRVCGHSRRRNQGHLRDRLANPCSLPRPSLPSCSCWEPAPWWHTSPPPISIWSGRCHRCSVPGSRHLALRDRWGVAILTTLIMRVAQSSVSFTAVTRLPMVAGEGMLPAWFSRLHQVPDTGQLDRAGWAVLVWPVGDRNIGVGQAEAFQLLFNASEFSMPSRTS